MTGETAEPGDGYSPQALLQGVARDRHPTFGPAACERFLSYLAADSDRAGPRELGAALGVLVRCTGPWPEGLSGPARVLARRALDAGWDGTRPFALLGLARLAGPDLHAEAAALAEEGCGPIAREELRLVAGWDATGYALLAEACDERWWTPLSPLPDVSERLADHGYAGFARSVLEPAGDRVEAVRSGEIPYEADKAFGADEVASLGRAARVALARDEPWLPELLDRIVRGVAVAPTAAKTLPSQALLYELARAAQDLPTPELATSLRTARTITRHGGVPKQLDKMLKRIDAALAERAEVALRLPALGFAADGTHRTPLGEHEAVVTVTGDGAELEWRGPGGRPLRSVPAAVRRDHAAAVKDLRDLVKRVRAHLTTLARALEGGFAGESAMPYAEWRERLAAHPLAGPMTRRLIWEFEVAPGEWRAALPDEAAELGEAGRVRLWHPIRSAPEEVRAWRDVITERRLRQPFKQAFREIYVLTPAEEETRVYSNRFAAHIVHYRRLFALFRARGWQSRLLGPWDGGDHDAAHRTLASGEWRVIFHHEYAEYDGERELAATDQVRMTRREGGAWREAPLAEVPAVVFSEAMRDVDLFVGVTSIAADPDWEDRGEERHWAYWREAGFGALTASAEVRRDALARILPRTKIAGRCELDGRFLVVRGDLRTYRIHLGSGNILMEPDASYLCIVPASGKGTGPQVFLPFEDERLALILSKAFLLAADTTITDPTILAQLGRGA
ncbi:DUF4132 domain-containing protein [Actinomadura rugatobispora]|uniref:DUF4132 domain-containing protein n=1 Tax=Actinomadura rugatobispora TaxID=1994 RepID=A0ABW0ZVF4_9ACTN|nr:hypothetical protein GCM10010200_008910 [Actinomadura rugatobispora]